MKKTFWYIVGILLIIIYWSPYILMQENSFFRIHDYLEQDFVYIYLNSKYLLHPFSTNIPELFDGAYRAAIQEHSFIQILLYKLFSGVNFLIANNIMMSIIGYTGIFVLLNKMYRIGNSFLNNFIIIIVGFLFAITPLLIHGATVMAFPLFVYLIILLNERHKIKEVIYLCCLSFFLGLSTSLVYGSFIFVGILFLIGLINLIRKKYFIAMQYMFSFLLLLFGYIINFFYSFIGIGELSHRVEWEISKNTFWDCFSNYFLHGNGEIPSFHLITFIIFIIATFFVIKTKKITKEYKYSLFSLFIIITIIFFSSMYTSSDILIGLRLKIGSIFKSLQLDRISYYISPLWYIILGSLIIYLNKLNKCYKAISKKIIICLIIALSAIQLVFILNYSEKIYKRNLTRKNVISYAEYFQQDLMSEIKDYINKPQSSYRIVSFGINPGIALFNGFYCLDGYSTNYSLKYKHWFRSVIKNEIDKNEAYKKYYDNWGSRVYIVSSELKSFTPYPTDNHHIVINSLDINYKVLKEKNCQYILSAYQIRDNSNNIKFEKCFSNDKNKIYLYRII